MEVLVLVLEFKSGILINVDICRLSTVFICINIISSHGNLIYVYLLFKYSLIE